MSAAEQLDDLADALGAVRQEDGAPLLRDLNHAIEVGREVREERDELRTKLAAAEERAKSAEAKLAEMEQSRRELDEARAELERLRPKEGEAVSATDASPDSPETMSAEESSIHGAPAGWLVPVFERRPIADGEPVRVFWHSTLSFVLVCSFRDGKRPWRLFRDGEYIASFSTPIAAANRAGKLSAIVATGKEPKP